MLATLLYTIYTCASLFVLKILFFESWRFGKLKGRYKCTVMSGEMVCWGGGVQAFYGAGGIKNLGRSHQENERQALNYFSLSAQQTISS